MRTSLIIGFLVLIIEIVVRIVNNLKDLNGFKIGVFHIDVLPLFYLYEVFQPLRR